MDQVNDPAQYYAAAELQAALIRAPGDIPIRVTAHIISTIEKVICVEMCGIAVAQSQGRFLAP